MFVQPELRDSDYSYNKFGQYIFGVSAERARKGTSNDVVTAMAGSLERLCLPNNPELDYYGSTTVEIPDSHNPYRNLPQYRNSNVLAVESADALTCDDYNSLPDVFNGVYFAPSMHSPKAPNTRTLNKRRMSADSLCNLQALPSLSNQSIDHQKLRDYSRQSLEDLSALPRFSSYLQEPDCKTAMSMWWPSEERDCWTAQSIRSGLEDTEEHGVATAMSIVSMREEEGVTTAMGF